MVANIVIDPKTLIENKCKRDFVSCEDLFPKWMTARIMLESWVNKIGGIDINVDRLFRSINIMFVLPEVRDTLSVELIPEHLTFPPEDQPQLARIVESVIIDYQHPGYESMICETIQDSLINRVRSMHQEVVDTVVSMGGRTPLDELKFRLGLCSFQFSIGGTRILNHSKGERWN